MLFYNIVISSTHPSPSLSSNCNNGAKKIFKLYFATSVDDSLYLL